MAHPKSFELRVFLTLILVSSLAVGFVSAQGRPLAIEDYYRTQVSAVGKVFGEDLDGNRSVQTGVGSAINFAHTARANERRDFVWAESRSCREGHRLCLTGQG